MAGYTSGAAPQSAALTTGMQLLLLLLLLLLLRVLLVLLLPLQPLLLLLLLLPLSPLLLQFLQSILVCETEEECEHQHGVVMAHVSNLQVHTNTMDSMNPTAFT